jgi:hypothetical protein
MRPYNRAVKPPAKVHPATEPPIADRDVKPPNVILEARAREERQAQAWALAMEWRFE